jgi:hypothetical protein
VNRTEDLGGISRECPYNFADYIQKIMMAKMGIFVANLRCLATLSSRSDFR